MMPPNETMPTFMKPTSKPQEIYENTPTIKLQIHSYTILNVVLNDKSNLNFITIHT